MVTSETENASKAPQRGPRLWVSSTAAPVASARPGKEGAARRTSSFLVDSEALRPGDELRPTWPHVNSFVSTFVSIDPKAPPSCSRVDLAVGRDRNHAGARSNWSEPTTAANPAADRSDSVDLDTRSFERPRLQPAGRARYAALRSRSDRPGRAGRHGPGAPDQGAFAFRLNGSRVGEEASRRIWRCAPGTR